MAQLTCHWCIHVSALSHKNHAHVPPDRMHSRWRKWATRTTYVMLGAAPALAIGISMTKLQVPGCENSIDSIQRVWPKTKYVFACVAWQNRLRRARYINASWAMYGATTAISAWYFHPGASLMWIRFATKTSRNQRKNTQAFSENIRSEVDVWFVVVELL